MRKTYSINNSSNLEAYCPQECQTCKTGAMSDGGAPIKNGICESFCSETGYCGNGEAYKGGVDCSRCKKSMWFEENTVFMKFTC